MSDVAVSVLRDGAQCRVVIVGELDLTTNPMLHERLAEATGNVVIDCRGLTFADSSAISEFVQLAQRVTEVRVEHPTPILRRTLEALGLTDVLPMSD